MKRYCLHQVLTFLQCSETGSIDNSERIPDWLPLCAKLQNFYNYSRENKIKCSAFFSYCRLMLTPALFDCMYFLC